MKQELGNIRVCATFRLKEVDFGQNGFLEIGTEQMWSDLDDFSDLGVGKPVFF